MIGVDTMSLNKLENDICKLVDNKKINLRKVEELFKQGANPNALYEDSPYHDLDGSTYYSTLFSECIFNSQYKKPDLYSLLKLFIKYGLDVNKYGPSIISDFHFIRGKSDLYEMTKLMLNHMDRKTDISVAISGIDVESSHLNCSFKDMDAESNDLLGLCIMLESFSGNKPYQSFYRLPKKINELFKCIHVSGDFVILEKNKIAVKSDRSNACMFSKIEMEKNTLIVEDSYAVYINNEDTHEYKDNVFTRYANEYLKNEKVVDLKFKHFEVKLSKTTYAQGRVVTINFTNNKKIVYEVDTKNSLETIEIV